MSLNLSTRDSLLHGVSFNKKGKIIWTRSFEDLRMFVEEVLDLTDGVWGCPGGFAKQFKSENIDFRWYSDSQTITLSGKAKDEIGEWLNSAALISEKLANPNSREGSKIDIHVGEKYTSSTLNFDDSRDENNDNRPFVDESFNDAFKYLENKMNELNSAFIKRINDLEQVVFETKDNEQHLLMSELKRENQELKNENQALRDKIINLTLIASDMKTKVEDMENERLSLTTAIRLIQTAPYIDADTEQPFQIQNEKKRNVKHNSKQKSEAAQSSITLTNRYEVLSTDDEQSGIKSKSTMGFKDRTAQVQGQHNDKKQPNIRKKFDNDKVKSTKGPAVILGDSMVKMLQPTKLARSVGQRVQVKTFPGATIADMEHYVQPTLDKKPKLVVLHVGTNDLQNKEQKELTDGMKLLCQGIVTRNPTTEIALSEIVRRQDLAVNSKIHETNALLSNLCEEANWYFIRHDNIDTKHLNGQGCI